MTSQLAAEAAGASLLATTPSTLSPATRALVAASSVANALDPALQLLALLQREGRLIDFLEQDVAAYSDADVGAAARAVHEGCRNVLHSHATLRPVRSEEEGARVTIAAGFPPDEIKLTGRVQGSAPYTGTLRHRGWRATAFTLPNAVRACDARVLAPAEVEL